MLLAAACEWDHLDAIGPAVPGGDAEAIGVENNDAAVVGADDVAETAQQSEAGISADAALGDADADSGPSDVVGESDEPVPEGGPSSAACTGSPAVVRQWTFDSDMQSWRLSTDPGVQASLTWNSSTGDPNPGALQVDVTRDPIDAGNYNGAWAQYDMTPLGNLSGRIISAWVWLDQGASPQVKLFVQTGIQFAWADNGATGLTPHVWTCLSLQVSSPSYNGPNYDPTAVVRVGFEMRSTMPFRLFIDTVRYF